MKKRTNKSISLLLVSIMIISSLISLGGISSIFANDVKNLDTGNSKDVSGIVKQVEFKSKDNYKELKIEFADEYDIVEKDDYIIINISKENVEFNIFKEEIDLIIKDEENEHNGESIGKVFISEGEATIVFNELAEKLKKVAGSFYIAIEEVRLKDPSKVGNIVVNVDNKKTYEKIDIPEENDNSGEVNQTTNLFYKEGQRIKHNKIKWSLIINSTKKSFDATNVYKNQEYKFMIEDKLPSTMKWNKEDSISNAYAIEIEDSTKKREFIKIEDAKEKGINVTFEDDKVIVDIENRAIHPLSGQTIIITLYANIKDEVLKNEEIKEVVNRVIIDSTLSGFDNVAEGDKEKAISIRRSGGIGHGTMPENGELIVFKHIEGTRKPIKGVKFIIIDENENLIGEIETNEKGFAAYPNLKQGKYKLKEIEVPDGIYFNELDPTTVEFEISEEAGAKLEISNKEEKPEVEKTIDFSVKKIWKNTDDDKLVAEFILFQDKDVYEGDIKPIRDEYNVYTWNGLPFADENGKKYEYTVEEANVNDNIVEIGSDKFLVDVKKQSENMFVITNKKQEKPNKPDTPTTDTPDEPKEETKPSYPNKNEPERPGSSIPDIPNRPKNPNKKDPIKPEEPVIEEPNKPLEEEPKDLIISDSKVDPNKSDKEVDKEEITEKDKVVQSNNQVVSNKLDPNKAPQTGDVFNIGKSLLVIFASISALFIISKKKKEN